MYITIRIKMINRILTAQCLTVRLMPPEDELGQSVSGSKKQSIAAEESTLTSHPSESRSV